MSTWPPPRRAPPDLPVRLEIRRKWNPRRIGVVTFGLLLWLQMATAALSWELAYTEPDFRRVLVYLSPLPLLVVATVWRLRTTALLLFPSSFGGILLVTPPTVTDRLSAPLPFGLTALTLVGYVLFASAWLQLPHHTPVVEATREPVGRQVPKGRGYRAMIVPRALLLVAIFAVTAAAVPLLPEMIERVASPTAFGRPGDPQALERGLVLCNMILFFVWCVLAFSLFLTPALEMEGQVRRLETQLQALLVRSQSRRGRIAFFVAVLSALGLLAALVGSRYR